MGTRAWRKAIHCLQSHMLFIFSAACHKWNRRRHGLVKSSKFRNARTTWGNAAACHVSHWASCMWKKHMHWTGTEVLSQILPICWLAFWRENILFHLVHWFFGLLVWRKYQSQCRTFGTKSYHWYSMQRLETCQNPCHRWSVVLIRFRYGKPG